MLISNERLNFIDIITLSIGESQMVSLVSSSVGWSQQVRDHQVEKLRHVDDVQEFGTVPGVEPHPVSVRLEPDGLHSQELKEVRSILS